jgi:hypothetical protein
VSLQRKTQKPLLKQPKPQHQPLSNRELDDNDDIIVDDEVVFGRNRKTECFGKVIHEDELSDYVMARLAQAREMAMAKYKEKWA